MAPSRPASRREVLRTAGALAAVGVVGTGSVAAHRLLGPAADPRTEIALFSQTVAYDTSGRRVLVGGRGEDLALAPGARVAEDLPDSSPVRAREAAFWEGTAPWRERLAARGAPGRTELAEAALRDLWVLSDDLPAPVAAWSSSWRHVWPRDAAFAAVALARVGVRERSVAVLEHLQSVQGADGWFEARYDPVTDRAPDGRPRQFDGTGLLLWAAGEIIGSAPAEDREELHDRLSPLITTSHATLLRSTALGTTLPPASPDYWERTEREVTLGIMAPTLAGLRAGAALDGSADAREAARTFSALLEGTFGATGYQRYRLAGGADSARALLDATGCHGLVGRRELLALREELARPGGGIAPGALWREDGISWTPSTSLLALGLARAGESEAAAEMLDWLAAHRTEAGSLPEKVLHDGRPAEVAPLAWTAANVLLTLDVLAA